MDFDNEITIAVKKLQDRLDTLDQAKLDALEEATNIDYNEWFILGDKASFALAHGAISQDVAMKLHDIHTHFNNGATIAERMIFIQTMIELKEKGVI